MAAIDLEAFNHKITAAADRIKDYTYKTPLEHSSYLSDFIKANVYLKLETQQVTGSFKARGAFNKLSILKSQPGIEKGIITSSSGNHGLATNLALKTLGIKGTIFVPEIVAEGKKQVLLQEGATLQQFGLDCLDCENKARETAEVNGVTFLSPYNDLDVIAGQGTIGLEILEKLPSVDYVLVPVGGGGLIAGIAAYMKYKSPKTKIVGVQPANSKVMYESVKAGKIIYEESLETLSDGTAGGIEEDSVTFPFCRDLVDDWIMVAEEDISRGIYTILEKHHKLIEGAAGCAVGALMTNKKMFEGKTVVAVMCGANISMNVLKHIVNEHSKVE
ncbi:unnamed protein product [Owenia fusiformis]|uniref:L-serine ammonia-lyase n=1 Tax=Owenia fusiformis TaxID=6347 RepID=A0A8S4PRG3_OWEFU|nr:unnamed protein product [Owenia fusiformis]